MTNTLNDDVFDYTFIDSEKLFHNVNERVNFESDNFYDDTVFDSTCDITLNNVTELSDAIKLYDTIKNKKITCVIESLGDEHNKIKTYEKIIEDYEKKVMKEKTKKETIKKEKEKKEKKLKKETQMYENAIQNLDNILSDYKMPKYKILEYNRLKSESHKIKMSVIKKYIIVKKNIKNDIENTLIQYNKINGNAASDIATEIIYFIVKKLKNNKTPFLQFAEELCKEANIKITEIKKGKKYF